MQAPHRTVRRGLKQERMTLHLTPQQEATLDAAQRTSGAGSRSELITRILEEDLGVDATGRPAG